MNEDQTLELIVAVRKHVAILEVVSEHTQLVCKGNEYVGVCPLKTCNSNRFCVKTKTGFFCCFGCGASGDVFAFVELTRGLKFLDAVKYLADKYKVTTEK